MLRGICYHHAGLTIDERQVLDGAVRSGVLRVIIATTTLAVGVDFPVEVVILNGLKSGMSDLSPSEYKQMAGRAGRRSAGEVFVIESQERFQFAISLLNATIPPVKSALTGDQRGIDRVLLEAITLGIVSTIDDMMRYLHISMLSLCVSEAELRRIVLESVGYLQEFQIIHGFASPSGVLLRPSRLGRAISSSLLPIEESILLYRDLFLHQTHIMLNTYLFLVYFITPTFVVPYPRWSIFERVPFFLSLSNLSSSSRFRPPTKKSPRVSTSRRAFFPTALSSPRLRFTRTRTPTPLQKSFDSSRTADSTERCSSAISEWPEATKPSSPASSRSTKSTAASCSASGSPPKCTSSSSRRCAKRSTGPF